MSGDVVTRAKAALEGITEGPWEHHVAPSDGSAETPAEYLANTLIGSGEPLHVLTARSPEPKFAYIVPAVTGDGPTSAVNAEFIAAARSLVPDLVREVQRLRRLDEERRNRDGGCICDCNPETTGGPEEDCPWHGREYRYWVDGCASLAAEVERLRAELDA